MNYKGYIIEEEKEPWALHFGINYRFYPEGGIDCDWTGDSWKSNVRSASDIEDAKEQIDEIILES